MTSVGFWTCSMVQAIVALLPEPVMPSSVWNRSPRFTPSASEAIAFGWSPAGAKSETTLKSGTLPSLERGCDSPEVCLGPDQQLCGAAEHPRTERRDAGVHVEIEQLGERPADAFGGEGGARLVLLGEQRREAVARHPVARVGRPGLGGDDLCDRLDVVGVGLAGDLEQGDPERVPVPRPPGDQRLHVLEEPRAVAESGE